MPTATMRRLLGPVAVIGVLAGSGLVPAASATVVIGQSIDGIKLGETQAQVQVQLGPPVYKEEVHGESVWGFPTTFEGRITFDTTLQVKAMWTISKQQKTNKGIGPGSSLAKLRKAYPQVKCATGPFGPKSLFCTLKSKDNGRVVETAFPFYTRALGIREVDINFV